MPVTAIGVPGQPATNLTAWQKSVRDALNSSDVTVDARITAAINAAKGDTAWTVPGSLLNSWVNYGSGLSTFRYRKVYGNVTVMGAVKSGTIAVPIFTLPAGYRPASSVWFPGTGPSGTSLTMSVDTAGSVAVQVYGTGATNALVGFSITYPAD